MPDQLRGYVELTYDLSNRANARFIEPLLYRSRFYQEASQSVSLMQVDGDWRLLTTLAEPFTAYAYDGTGGATVAGVELLWSWHSPVESAKQKSRPPVSTRST